MSVYNFYAHNTSNFILLITSKEIGKWEQKKNTGPKHIESDHLDKNEVTPIMDHLYQEVVQFYSGEAGSTRSNVL